MFNHQEFEKQLKEYITKEIINVELQEILLYSLLPAGKLFRPQLAYNLASDFSIENNQLNSLLMSLELHHAYTLVHDDLPCMDNDDYRRGKLSVHKKYGQWQAVLCGDALLNLSYGLLGKLQHNRLNDIITLFNSRLGANGLILGQWLDLQGKAKNSHQQAQRIHYLKTAELINVTCLSIGHLGHFNLKKLNKVEKFATSLGLCFQLLDDLSELNTDVSNHEESANAFLTNPSQASDTLIEKLNHLQLVTRELNLQFTKKFIGNYLEKSHANIEKLLPRYTQGIKLKEIRELLIKN